MTKPDWQYSWLRDKTAFMIILPGALGAVVASMWMPLVWKTAAAARGAGQETAFILLFVLPVCFMVLWTFAWWGFAAKRVFRMRRLLQNGVAVEATVERMELHRHRRSITGVTLWLQYELDGQLYNIKKKTAWRKVIAPARDHRRIDLVVDPESPLSVALLVDDRLG